MPKPLPKPGAETALLSLAVFAGGFVGTLGRWSVNQVFSYPLAHLVVNLTGAFFLALLYGFLAGDDAKTKLARAGFGTGLIGSWTSYSALAIATLSYSALPALGYLLGTIIGGMLAALAGYQIAKSAKAAA